MDDESLHIIARKADGGMRDALSMYDKVVSFCGSNLTADKVAETLNVLDYDTYFTVTDRILEGDYTATLLLFDEVLRKGFSGQTFIGGTKRPPARSADVQESANDSAAGGHGQRRGTLQDTGRPMSRSVVVRGHRSVDLGRRLPTNSHQPTATHRTGSDETLRTRSKIK